MYSLGTTVSAAVMVWAGGLTDIFRVRRIGAIIFVALAVSCAAMALNPVWWLLPVVIFALRFTGQGMSTHIAVVAMARWFVAARGRALSVAKLGFSLGEAVLPVLFVALMLVMDWRLLWLIAALIAVLGAPLLLVLLRQERTPQSHAKSGQSLGMEARHWTRNQTFRHWLFWFMIPALLGPSAFNTAFFFHQVHIAEVKAMSHVELVAMFPFYTAISIGAMILSGWAIDLIGTPRLIPWMQLPMVVAFALFAMAEGTLGMLVGFFFLGLNTGFNNTLPSAFWAEFYGTRHIGAIKAMAAAVMVLGSAIGPGVSGVAIDLGVGIEVQFWWIAGFFVLSTGLMVLGVGRAKGLLPGPA
ncbi:MFS transporter [Roseovarius sp. D0-M9]|uniref:MFS transporter n=1 Tax=Roseovarius sp. D0-M9 TaxID=3127117 RepID=UPI00300FAEB0